jgi:histone-lysine N-methyltransferase SUV420H
MGEEITTHYGSSYCEQFCFFARLQRFSTFVVGYKNKDCLCATCERRGKGGYAPRTGEEEGETLFTAVLRDYESDSSIGAGSDDEPEAPVNVNERRTRRGVYHVNKDKGKQKQSDCDTDDSGSEGMCCRHTSLSDNECRDRRRVKSPDSSDRYQRSTRLVACH